MNVSRDLDHALAEAATFLLANHEGEWSERLQSARAEVAVSLKAGAEKALSMFAGAGSLHDIVLMAGDRPSVEANDQLDALRGQIYQSAKLALR